MEGQPLKYVDPEGLEKIILFYPKGADAWAYEAAKAVPDKPDVCTVYAHGKSGLIGRINHPDGEVPLPDVAKIIEEQCKPKQPVQLMSCKGGAGGDDSVAKKLADATGRQVSGYDRDILHTGPLWPFRGSVTPVPGASNKTYGGQ